ncbi:MAG: hypothetical protein AABY09_02440 [Nanoarchaeota archaeon]
MDYAKANGIDYIDLRSDRVTGKEFESVIKKKQPKLVIFNGHGNEEMVTGHKCSPLIQINKNEPLLINKIVYAISCKSAQKLGISCVKNGTLAYIGYNEDFIFVFDKTKTFDPSEDELARYFLEPSNELILSLLKGNTAKQAFDNSQLAYNKKIDKLLSSEAPVASENLLWILFWDRDNQVIIGDGNSSFN